MMDEEARHKVLITHAVRGKKQMFPYGLRKRGGVRRGCRFVHALVDGSVSRRDRLPASGTPSALKE